MQDLSFKATIWIRKHATKPGARHFVSLPKDTAKLIKEQTKEQPRKGRGSIKVEVRIGFVTWQTSIFPDKQSETYLLPLKASVRNQLHIVEGDDILVYLKILP